MQQAQQASTLTKKKASIKSETVFKIVTCVIAIMWSTCINKFLEFRQVLSQKQLLYFQFEYSSYILVSFCFMFVTKYGYYLLAKDYVDKKILSEAYEGESRRLKLQSVLKLSYDSVFYLCCSGISYYLFSQQPWFPNWVGGKGTCENTYIAYPSIPARNKNDLEMFYCLQLGVHMFSVFEMMVIKRKTQPKYYQKLLHHILAASLIIFSAATNEVLAGTMILFVHDSSDIFLAFGRTYVETKFKKTWYVAIPIVFLMLFIWIYMRIFVFPLCLIANVMKNDATLTGQWSSMYYPHKMMIFKVIVLLGMHVYWTYHLIRSIFLSLKKKSYENHHETGKEKVAQPQTQTLQ